jgi:hypothetical protein
MELLPDKGPIERYRELFPRESALLEICRPLPCGKDRERYLLKDLQYLLNGTTHIPMLIKAAISIDIIIAIRYFHQRKWGQAQEQQLPTASLTEN